MTLDRGLDMSALRGLQGRRRDHKAVLDRIAEHLDIHGGFVAWSGGKDSTAVVDLARQINPTVPVVFYDSGLEFPETLDYINRRARSWSLNLSVIRADPDLLTMLVAAGDFDRTRPSKRLGWNMRAVLIEEPAAIAHSAFGPGLLWGIRSAESSGRRILHSLNLTKEIVNQCGDGCCSGRASAADRHGGTVRRVDGTAAFSPIWNWTTPQVWEHLAGREVPANPLYAKLAALGADEHATRVDAIIDPNHLTAGQITRLARGWPDLYARLAEALPRVADYR